MTRLLATTSVRCVVGLKTNSIYLTNWISFTSRCTQDWTRWCCVSCFLAILMRRYSSHRRWSTSKKRHRRLGLLSIQSRFCKPSLKAYSFWLETMRTNSWQRLPQSSCSKKWLTIKKTRWQKPSCGNLVVKSLLSLRFSVLKSFSTSNSAVLHYSQSLKRTLSVV